MSDVNFIDCMTVKTVNSSCNSKKPEEVIRNSDCVTGKSGFDYRQGNRWLCLSPTLIPAPKSVQTPIK